MDEGCREYSLTMSLSGSHSPFDRSLPYHRGLSIILAVCPQNLHQGFLRMLSDITATVQLQPSLAFRFWPLQISKYGLANFSDGDGIVLHRPAYNIPYAFNPSMTLMTCTV